MSFVGSTPLRMVTVHHEAPWRCPWCRAWVLAGETHEDRSRDRVGFVPRPREEVRR